MIRALTRAVAVSSLGLVGCSPTFDWREVPIVGTELVGRFPCHPTRLERMVEIAGRPVSMSLTSCDQAGVAYGIATGDVRDPMQVEAALVELAESARSGIGAPGRAGQATVLPGVTPNRANVRLRLRGQGPDGRPVEESVTVFARGTQVFQVTAAAPELPASAVEPFEAGLRFRGFR